MADIVSTFRRGDGGEGRPDRRPQAGHRARGDGPQAGFEFGKDLLDGIEVRAVGGQIEQVRASRLDRLAHPGHFMTGQIVQDDAVARLECGGEHLFNIGDEARAIDWAVEDGGGDELVGPQGGNEGGRLPLAVGDLRHEARAAATAAIAAGQLRLERGLVEEDEAGAVERRRLGAPVLPGRPDIRPLLFGGVQDFFLRSARAGARSARPW